MFFKELWMLFTLLFSDVSKIKELKPLKMKCFPFKGYKYMMWCGYCIYRSYRPKNKNVDKVSLNHESIHLQQAKDCGSWLKFYWQYLREWLKCVRIFKDTNLAYYASKFEAEAYKNEKDFDYLKNRRHFAHNKYTNYKENVKRFIR